MKRDVVEGDGRHGGGGVEVMTEKSIVSAEA